MGDTRTGARAPRGAKRPIRRRAVGTRDRILSHLAAVGAIADVTGMASTRLAEAVGYPGSSVAFAQLLSGMERDGLIVREVRGKRTYRITLPEGQGAGPELAAATGEAGVGDAGLPGAGTGDPDLAEATAAAAPGGFDYDELARRLLVQVLRKLASGALTAKDLATVDVPGALAERVGTLTAENERLREQLSQAQRDLALERNRRASLSGELGRAEVVVLERLLDGNEESASLAFQGPQSMRRRPLRCWRAVSMYSRTAYGVNS